MTWRIVGSISTVAALFGLACGPSQQKETDGATDPTGDDGGDGGDDGQTGTADDACSDYLDDEAMEPAVAITIRNTGPDPIYLTQAVDCAPAPLFELRRDMTVDWYAEWCAITCQQAMQGQCACPGACPMDTVIQIDSGGRYKAIWPGNELVPAELPLACADDLCGRQCMINRQAPAGDYTIEVTAGTDTTCPIESCDCQQQDTQAGWCSRSGQIAEPTVTAEATFRYPDTTAIEVVFD